MVYVIHTDWSGDRQKFYSQVLAHGRREKMDTHRHTQMSARALEHQVHTPF